MKNNRAKMCESTLLKNQGSKSGSRNVQPVAGSSSYMDLCFHLDRQTGRTAKQALASAVAAAAAAAADTDDTFIIHHPNGKLSKHK